MRRAIAVHTHWPAAERCGSVTLPFDQRHRRRVAMTADDGTEFLLDLPSAAHLRDGDGLELEGGGFLQVIAAAEPVAEVACDGPAALARVAWHVGNRHMPVQVLDGGTLLVPDDHVLAHMLEGLGATVRRLTRPFQPETGAYERHGH
jgi:urease accessory protein